MVWLGASIRLSFPFLLQSARRSCTTSSPIHPNVSEESKNPSLPIDPRAKAILHDICKDQLPTVLYTGRYWPTTLLQSLPDASYLTTFTTIPKPSTSP